MKIAELITARTQLKTVGLRDKARFIGITNAGLLESHPRVILITTKRRTTGSAAKTTGRNVAQPTRVRFFAPPRLGVIRVDL